MGSFHPLMFGYVVVKRVRWQAGAASGPLFSRVPVSSLNLSPASFLDTSSSVSIHHSPFWLRSAARGIVSNPIKYAFTRHEQHFAWAPTSQIDAIGQASVNGCHSAQRK